MKKKGKSRLIGCASRRLAKGIQKDMLPGGAAIVVFSAQNFRTNGN
jgi:hypothetical protein